MRCIMRRREKGIKREIPETAGRCIVSLAWVNDYWRARKIRHVKLVVRSDKTLHLNEYVNLLVFLNIYTMVLRIKIESDELISIPERCASHASSELRIIRRIVHLARRSKKLTKTKTNITRRKKKKKQREVGEGSRNG